MFCGAEERHGTGQPSVWCKEGAGNARDGKRHARVGLRDVTDVSSARHDARAWPATQSKSSVVGAIERNRVSPGFL
jgi:hypothetical protein